MMNIMLYDAKLLWISDELVMKLVLHMLQCDLPAPSDRRMGTTEATLRMENLEVKDEWQDEDFPR